VGREYIISSKCLGPYGILLADLTIVTVGMLYRCRTNSFFSKTFEKTFFEKRVHLLEETDIK
jgi:hypothetical protein